MVFPSKFRRKPLPKTAQDWMASTFLLTSIATIVTYEFIYILPQFHDVNSFWYTFNVYFASFLLVNVVCSYIWTVVCDTSIQSVVIRASETHSTQVCLECECYKPKRAHHCRTCQICILKRDHHCNFTGCCIGLSNMRYFITFLIYLSYGASYLSAYNLIYMYRLGLYPKHFLGIFKFLLPMLSMFLSDFSSDSFLILATVLCLICSVWAWIFLLVELSLICRGLVMYDRKVRLKVNQYDRGFIENFRAVFGDKFYVSWFCVLIDSQLPRDDYLSNWDCLTFKMK